MDDKDFFDLLYQGWTKTTGAENMFWMPEKVTSGADELWEVYAVDQHQEKHFIATFQGEEDAAFVTALHGCFGDLVRRLHEAVDKAESLEVERDEQEGTIAGIAQEVIDLERQIERGYN